LSGGKRKGFVPAAGLAIAAGVSILALAPSGCSRAPAPEHAPRPSAVVRAEPTVRVVLASGMSEIEVAGAGELTLGGGSGRRSWPGGGTLRVRGGPAGISAVGPDGVSVTALGDAVEIRSSDGVVAVSGVRYRGSARIIRSSEGTLTAVNLVGLESYLKGVLAAEIGALSEDRMAAMKAQAVASRSYTLYRIADSRGKPYDVVSGVGDQVYRGIAGERPVTDRAVEETFGEVAVYRGEPIRANFSSTCGGVTVANEDAWPDEEPLPYLRSVRDVIGRRGGELCAGSRHYRWREEWDADQLDSILSSYFVEAAAGRRFEGRVRDIKVVRRNDAGRAKVVEIRTDRGKYKVRADKIRWALRRADGGPLWSTFFELKLEKRRGRVKKLVAVGRGWGHGVGMCQWGAIGMADRGYDYKDILHHYYAGIDIVRMYGPSA